jgi:hypothetical protein
VRRVRRAAGLVIASVGPALPNLARQSGPLGDFGRVFVATTLRNVTMRVRTSHLHDLLQKRAGVGPEQEFVVGGYIPGSRGFDALLVGVYENKRLMLVAKVKNGFLSGIRSKILRALETLRTSQCPFGNLPEVRASRWGEALTAEKMKECRWIEPMLVLCGIPASSRCAMIKSRQRSFGKLERNSHLKRRKVREAFRRSPWLL